MCVGATATPLLCRSQAGKTTIVSESRTSVWQAGQNVPILVSALRDIARPGQRPTSSLRRFSVSHMPFCCQISETVEYGDLN